MTTPFARMSYRYGGHTLNESLEKAEMVSKLLRGEKIKEEPKTELDKILDIIEHPELIDDPGMSDNKLNQLIKETELNLAQLMQHVSDSSYMDIIKETTHQLIQYETIRKKRNPGVIYHPSPSSNNNKMYNIW